MRKLTLTIVLAGLGLPGGQARSAGPIDFTRHPINQWVKHSPRKGAPIPRWQWEGSGGYDPQRDLWVHHGGHDGGPQGFATFTMAMPTARWRQRLCNTYPPGVCCVDGSNVFHEAAGVFVRFPSAALGHGWQWSRSVFMKGSHAWLYDPAGDRWTNMRPPPYAEPARYSREWRLMNGAGGLERLSSGNSSISFGYGQRSMVNIFTPSPWNASQMAFSAFTSVLCLSYWLGQSRSVS